MRLFAIGLACCGLLFGADAAKPKATSEALRFNVNWPSGLSLGEGQMTSAFSGTAWSFAFNVEFAIPAFAVIESAKSSATADLCATQAEKQFTRGKKTGEETTTFDASKLTATRETGKGGGKSEMQTSACARDALTYIQFLRKELAAGRIPSGQTVYYGAGYSTRVQYLGTMRVPFGGEAVEADKLQATIKGPASEYTVEMLFARDAVRTPVQFQIPVTIGKFTVEFLR